MGGPATLRKALLLLACVAAPLLSGVAADRPVSREADTANADPLGRLYQSQRAARVLAYSGRFVYQQGMQIRTSRITHRPTAKSATEKIEILDGRSQETIRTGEEIMHYLPDERRIVIERRGREPQFPDMLPPDSREIVRYYTVRSLGEDRVAGRDTHGIALEPRDGLRYGYRFWTDRSTGLLLRAQTLSEKGEIIEQIAFTQIEIGKVRPSQLKTRYTDTRGWRIETVPATAHYASGWRAGWLPGGFRPVRSARHTLGNTDKAGDARDVVQLAFSDGLAGISVFIEPWSPQHADLPLQQGSLNMMGKRHGKFWLTIVGEVPLVTIRQIADTLEFVGPGPN